MAGVPILFKSISQEWPSRARCQTLGHASLQERLGEIIFILGIRAPCHTGLLLRKHRADPEMLL